LAQKKRVNIKAEARKHEEVKKTNLEKVDVQKEKIQGLVNQLKSNELYNAATGKNENAALLGFQGEEEFNYEERRGGRGFRGGRGAPRGGRGGNEAGARKQGGRKQMRAEEEEFPALV